MQANRNAGRQCLQTLYASGMQLVHDCRNEPARANIIGVIIAGLDMGSMRKRAVGTASDVGK